jgi:hypothetical protein
MYCIVKKQRTPIHDKSMKSDYRLLGAMFWLDGLGADGSCAGWIVCG